MVAACFENTIVTLTIQIYHQGAGLGKTDKNNNREMEWETKHRH
jgi:hypothetical protein